MVQKGAEHSWNTPSRARIAGRIVPKRHEPEAGYITIPNWRTFQHYQDGRQPAWIKLYTELLDNDEYRALSLSDRGLLQDLWKLISRTGNGRLSVDRVSIARKLNVRRVSLEPLIQAGFIEVTYRRADRPNLDQSKRRVEESSSNEEQEGASSTTASRRATKNGATKESNGRLNAADRKAIDRCRSLYREYRAGGDDHAIALGALEELFRDPRIIQHAIPTQLVPPPAAEGAA